MTNLLDWNAISTTVYAHKSSYPELKDLPNSFQHLMLERLLDLTAEEAFDAITDGPNDRGIDAVFVEERNGANTIHLFQFKYVSSFEKSQNNFPSALLG